MGALSLAGRLDRETRELYTLWARATDGGGLMARARIYVSVADVNDCSPLLIPEAYSAEVDEEVEPGTFVVAINASDSDEGPNGKLEFTVLSGDPEGIFMIDSDGVLTVAGHLDREHQASFGLLIAVCDLASQLHLRHTATARVSVTVRDINDHSPTFEETYLKTSVSERIPVGTTLLVVSAKDLDMGSNGEVEYVLGKGRNSAVAHLQAKQKNSGVVTSVVPQVPNSGIEQDDKAKANMREIYFKEIDEGTKGSSGKESDVPFKLNAITGELRLLAALNHKLMSEYHLVVKASDKGIPKRSTLVELVVSVTSTNDGAPTFIQSLYRATCSESTPPGTVVTRVSATDSDDGLNGEIRYKQGFNSVDDDDDDEGADSDFRLDPATGELWVARLLDREQKSEYRFRIQAVDNGKPARRGRTEVLVTILDDNDCIPTFGTSDNMVHILENEDAMHKLIAQVKAEDEDLGPGGQLTYALVEGNESGKFSVSPNGQVFLEGALDRELTQLHRLVITATDAGVPPLTGTGTLTVIVKDSNDNAPQFQPEGVVLASVIEDALPGTTVAIIRATDNDEGSNSQIGYTLSGADSHFAVNLDTGTVITTATLDREMQAHYTLVVTATDGGSPSLAASATIAVTVTDANDHTPRFLNAPYVAYVPASAAAGDVLFAVTAHDPDEGLNGVLAFSLEGSNPAFAINSRHGALTAARHLHSSHDGQTFVVAASDGASPPRRARTTLTVRMRKPTDFPRPSGFHGPRAFSLRENVAPGTIVTTVTASSHRRGPVTYGLAAGGNPQNAFSIDPRTGTISVARPLDREMIEMFELLVEARDSGFPPYSRYIPITVDIEDINDNAPDFQQLYCESEAAENAGPLAEVARVQATDPDAGQNGQIKYDINDGNDNGLFRIDPDTGVVGTTRSLDREQTSQHVLIVVARDGGHPSLEGNTTLVLNVRDANDNAPRFARLYTTFVSESAPIGATVIHLEAHDADEDDNGAVTFSLAEPTLPFMIHPNTGSLIVSQPLDRETRASYVVRVLARDPAWTVGSDIAITVTDVNDKVPTFEQSKYEVELPVPAEAGVVITRLRAVDLDEGVNSQVVYVMDSQSDAFRIDPASGDVFTVRRQAIGWPNHFTLLVSALDQGNPQHFSRTSLLIHLVPRNEKPPMFTQPHYFTPVAVSAPIGVSIFHLEANDPDEAGPVLFDAVGGNGTEVFVMQDNGWLVLARSIVGLIGHGFGIEARARDQGQPLLVSLATVEVLVTDDNRAGPTFVHGSLATTMAEDAKLGSSVARVSAMDDDKGINGKLSYYLHEPSEYFTVNPSSGIITLVNPLAQDVSDDYLLNVCAHDGAWQSRKACIDVTLGVTRSSNAPPAFSQSAYMATIAENITFGATVLIVQAVAATYGGLFSYEITGEGSREFTMHPSSGTLTTQAFLDFETVQSYELIAWACSGSSHASGHRDACSHAALYIAVTGVNEYGPLFAERTFQFTVPESAPVGHTIGTVYAYDGDAGVDGIVTYLLATDITPFRLDSVSGALYVLSPLDHKIIDFTFRVVAKNLGPVQSAGDVDEAIVMVKVTDSNDPPKFSTAIYSTQVSEAASPGTAIVTVSATDPDGQASITDLIYNIAEGNPENIFQIEPDTGHIILQRELDREVVPAYNLTVIAVDQGEPRATGQALVVVKVLDTNDNAPTLLTVRASVAENRPVGTLVSQLKVNDDDLPPNAKPFTFRLLPRHTDKAGRGLFRLRTGGKLTTARSLDRERISKVLLVVSVTDNGNPAQSSTATLTVTITDDNDNAPKPRQVDVLVYSFDGVFPGGFVGNVQPNDPDVADRYSCEITSPHRRQPHSFSLESSSCRLIAPGRRSQETFEIKIKGHDGKHPASDTTAHVIFGTFDNVTLENSILLRLSGSLVHFLGHNYRPFLRAARKSLKTQGAGLIIYACSESTENSPSSALFLAAAPRPPEDGQHLYLPPADLTAFFQAEASTLERASAAILESANYDPCEFGGPCHNGGHCYRRLSVEKAIRPVESPPLVLTSHRLLPPAVCECPEGFQGIFCESNIDECTSGPCHNGATCIDDIGTYHCTCGRGFEGFACEMDINECLENPCANDGLCENQPGNFFCHCSSGFSGPTCASHIDHCEISPCFNNGTCTDTGDGYTCDCPFGTEGQRCEVHSYGLAELSFLLFPPLEPAPATHVSLRFATTHSNGLLLFIAEPSSAEILALKNSSFLAAQLPTRFPFESLGHSLHFSQPLYSTSFFALEIKNGQLQLTYNLGGGAFKLKTKQLVTDGQFHTISVHRMGMEATLTLDECGKMQPPGHCHASLLGGGASRSLPSRAWVWVGGLGPKALDRLARGQLESHDFVGCLAGVSVNGVPLQPRRSLASHNVHTSCESPREPCASGPCLNGGSCVDMWSSFYCKCRDAFAGKFCERVASEHTALSLDGSSRLDFELTEAYKRQRLLQEVSSKSEGSRAPGNFGEFEVTFRTRSKNGVLAWIAEMQNVTALTVEAGQLVYIWMTGRSVRAKRRMAEKVVDDGTWHTIRLERVGHEGLHAILNGKTMWRDPDHSPKNFGGSGSTQLGIGGAPSGGLGLGPGYQGCIHSVRYNGMALPFSGHHPAVILKTFGSQQPTLGCSGPDLCGPGHPACAPGLLCVDRWLIRECELPGACSSSPCKNGGRCEPQPPNTFTCRCPQSHVGPICETPIICLAAQCPAATECQAYGEIFRCVLLEPDIGPISGSMPFWVLVLAACALGLLLLLIAALAACMHRRRHKQAEAEGHSGTAGTPSGAAFSGGLGANKLGHKEGISNSKKGHKIGPEGSSLDAYSAVPGSRAPDGMAKPDIIEGDAPYLIVDETDIGESAGEADPNRGGPLGWSGSPTPEHYDLEAASSIAPSDADVISHYRRFRPRTALRGPSPLPPVTSYIPPGPSLLHHHHHHHAYPTLSSAASGRLPCTGLDICPNYAASQSISSCLHSGTGVTTISAGMRPCELRTVSPVGPLGPPVGLSLAEVERLNSAGRRRRVRPSQASTVEACSSSEEGAARESGRPTHRSYGVARAFGSESSGSESESHDSFTCSEFETERPAERPLRTPLAQLAESDGADANDDEDDDDDDDDDDSSKSRPRLISAHRLRKARKAERFTTALPATFAWDALLNLSPNLGHYIDVCNDLAALSFEEPVRTEEVSVQDKPEQGADTCKQTPTILTSPNEPTVQETEEYI
uniref:Uncharacterized protein n=1 Tax=Eptatretus burgeri TaxID=7764 RepID=A0A8C4Q5R5_EPTBU